MFAVVGNDTMRPSKRNPELNAAPLRETVYPTHALMSYVVIITEKTEEQMYIYCIAQCACLHQTAVPTVSSLSIGSWHYQLEVQMTSADAV